MYWGEVSEYDKSWREYAERNPNVDIMFFKFEDFIKNKAWVDHKVHNILRLYRDFYAKTQEKRQKYLNWLISLDSKSQIFKT